jgi:hypothetical protein
MDGSKEPPQTPSEAAWYATNVTFRGGNGPRTRPGFREIPANYWRNPQPAKSVSTVTISDGIATVTTGTNHEYDNGNKVTISGATPSGLDGTHVITVIGSDEFTFLTTETGSVSGTITARRDIDAVYTQDFINATTSRDRYISDIRGATYVQGAAIYQDPREGNPTQIIIVADGKIMALNLNDSSCYRLNVGDEISDDVPVYMTQAERYLIIQTGQDEPRIFDGYVVRRASYYGSEVVPMGKQMAYGQGRLFVAVNDGAEMVAGDIVFGGSLTNIGITGSSAANPTVVTTATNHGFSAGDKVTISGHSSSPQINSTYVIGTTPAANTFTIPVAVTSGGSGGFVARANSGQDSDVLRFTETTFLNEGGALAPTGKIGRITALAFLPLQDTATGQGDLIAFCERGAVTFEVSAPRDQWKNTVGFQRVLFDNIGSTSDSILPVNGDLFFRSREGNGIRTYRNARGESDGYGQTPVSAEIDPVLKQDTPWMLDGVTFASFDNRLLMTCLPRRFPRRAADQTQADQYAAEPVPTFYEGIAVLDFQSSSAGRGKSAAVFDGVWTGLRVMKLMQGLFDGDPRCFAICFHEDDTGRRVELWEITKNDEFDTPVEGKRRINAGIVTKAFNLGDQMSLKKLIRCDLWFDDLGGGLDYPFECELAYRPDDYPNFTTWQRFDRAVQTEFLLEDKNLFAYSSQFTDPAWVKGASEIDGDQIDSPLTPQSADLFFETTAGATNHTIYQTRSITSGLSYTLSVYAKGAGRNLGLHFSTFGSAFAGATPIFNLSNGTVAFLPSGVTAAIQDLGNGWYRCQATATATASATGILAFYLSNGTTLSYTGDGLSGVYLWGAQLEVGGAATSYDSEPPQLLNFERGYAPQVRFPTPPLIANIATNVPAYLGHDFTLRVNWSGRAHLGRLMLHGQRLIENVGGGSL